MAIADGPEQHPHFDADEREQHGEWFSRALSRETPPQSIGMRDFSISNVSL